MTNLFLKFVKNAAVGFVAGFVVACFVLCFLGKLPLHNDLNQLGLDEQSRSLLLACCFGCGVALLAAFAPRLKCSRFWLWFCVAFGIICLVPFWPGKDGSLLPLATPYLNYGFRAADTVLLAIHMGMALCLAALGHWLWPYCHGRFSSTGLQ